MISLCSPVRVALADTGVMRPTRKLGALARFRAHALCPRRWRRADDASLLARHGLRAASPEPELDR
jgi:hypothetical protein